MHAMDQLYLEDRIQGSRRMSMGLWQVGIKTGRYQGTGTSITHMKTIY